MRFLSSALPPPSQNGSRAPSSSARSSAWASTTGWLQTRRPRVKSSASSATFRTGLVSLFRHEKVYSYEDANRLLQLFLLNHNACHRVRTTGLTPDAAWRRAKREKRSLLQPKPPATLLDLHLALVCARRLARDNTIEFLGRSYPVSACAQKSVTIVLHPALRFWVLPHPPTPAHPAWPAILAAHSLTKPATKTAPKR